MIQLYLTEAQLSQLIKAARKGRHGQRDANSAVPAHSIKQIARSPIAT